MQKSVVNAVQVVGFLRQGQDPGDGSKGPLLPKQFHQLLQVVGGRRGWHRHDPQARTCTRSGAAIKELQPKLSSQQRHVLNDGQTHPLLGTASSMMVGAGTGQLLDADHLFHATEVGDDIQSARPGTHPQQSQEKGHEVLDGVIFAQDGAEAQR